MTLLVLTHASDLMRPMLERMPALARAHGEALVLVDTDRFPAELELDLAFAGDGALPAVRGTLVVDERPIDLAEIGAIWHRREAVGAALPPMPGSDVRAACVEESRAVFLGALAATDAFHLDPQHNRRLARVKPLQLELARREGLDVPRTITSNEGPALRAFAESCGGDVVFKLLENYVDPDAPGRVSSFTTRVRPGHLDDDAALALVPVTLQERVEKELELRVIVAGRRVFAAAVRSQGSELGRDDWRRDGRALAARFLPFELPAAVELALLGLMDRFGLQYGAADLILTPQGRFVFLELNPAGEFFWLEEQLGFPILASLVALLAGRAERRPQAPRIALGPEVPA